MSYGSILIFKLICLITLCLGCGKEENKSAIKKDTTGKVTEIVSSGNDSVTVNNTFEIDSVTPQTKTFSKDTLNSLKNKNIKDTLKPKVDAVKLIAYYFHPTARCVTCRNIEAYSIEAIQQWEEKTGKKVIWKELNIEDSLNEHFVKEYNLEFSSLVVAKYNGGKREKWKNLEQTGKLVNDKSSFIKYVIFELNQFLKNN